MRRREIIAYFGAATALPIAARAQQAGRIYRLGLLVAVPRQDLGTGGTLDGLADMGFVADKNLIADPRGFSLLPEQMAAVARQFVESKVDLLMPGGGPAIKAAQAASSTIPIVGIADDMVREGHVGSLANRGGNTTGISILATELDGKRQEILIELLPNAKKMAMLADASIPAAERLAALQARARSNGIEFAILPIEKPEDIEPALKRAKADGAAAINVLASPLFFANRQMIFASAAMLGLATIFQWAEGAGEGALAAYGPGFNETFWQWGRLAGKVLRGARPADLPVEQPTTFKLALNLKLARQLGITLPPPLLQRADEVLE